MGMNFSLFSSTGHRDQGEDKTAQARNNPVYRSHIRQFSPQDRLIAESLINLQLPKPVRPGRIYFSSNMNFGVIHGVRLFLVILFHHHLDGIPTGNGSAFICVQSGDHQVQPLHSLQMKLLDLKNQATLIGSF